MPNNRLRRVAGRSNLHIVWTEAGRTRTESTGTEDAAEAQAYLIDFLKDRHGPRAPKTQTIEQLLNAYFGDREQAGVVAVSRLREAGKPLVSHFGNDVPAGISGERIAGYRAFRAHCSPWTIRKELQVLKAALRWGERNGWYDKAPEISLGRTLPPRDRWLESAEADRLVAAAEGHVRTFILLLLHTGCRKSAALDLTWDRVDFRLGFVSFVDPGRFTTNKRRTVVPLNRTLRAELASAREMALSEYVVEYGGKRVGNIRHGFMRAAERAGLKDCTPHTLKHTFVSNLAARGVPIETIADLTATNPDTIRRVYRKINPGSLRDAVELLDGEKNVATLVVG